PRKRRPARLHGNRPAREVRRDDTRGAWPGAAATGWIREPGKTAAAFRSHGRGRGEDQALHRRGDVALRVSQGVGHTAPKRTVRVEGRKRILTGIRPTGPLHLGHYAGALENWVSLQTRYDCCFLIAAYQVSDYADDMARVREAVWEVALDWLAVGLDPQRSSFVIESLIPEHAELALWLSWFLPLGMLERTPTLKGAT